MMTTVDQGRLESASPPASDTVRWMAISSALALISAYVLQGALARAGVPDAVWILRDGALILSAVAAAARHFPRLNGPQSSGMLIVLLGCLSILHPAGENWVAVGYGARPFVLLGAAICLGASLWTVLEWSKLLSVAMVPSVVLASRQTITGLSTAEMTSVLESGSTYIVGGSVRLIGAANTGQDFSYTLLALAVAVSLLAVEQRSKGLWLAVGGVLLLQIVALQRSSLIGTALVIFAAYTIHLSRSANRIPRIFVAGAASILITIIITLQLPSVGAIDESDNHIMVAAARAASVGSGTSDFALQERLTRVWPEAINLASRRPLTGHGPGAVGPVSSRFPEFSPIGEFHPDNLALFILLQFGWFGIAFIIWIAKRLVISTSGMTLAVIPVVALASAGFFGSYLALAPGTVMLGVLFGASAKRLIRRPIAIARETV